MLGKTAYCGISFWYYLRHHLKGYPYLIWIWWDGRVTVDFGVIINPKHPSIEIELDPCQFETAD